MGGIFDVLQGRSRRAIKAQTVSLSPVMMRELNFNSDVFLLFTKYLLYLLAMSTRRLKSLVFGIPFPFSRRICCFVVRLARQHRRPRRPTCQPVR